MTTRVPFDLIGDGSGYHLMVKAKFNKKIEGTLIIDTGASKSIFDKTFSDTFARPLSKKDFLSQFPEMSVKDKLSDEMMEKFEVDEDGILTMGVDSKSLETNFAIIDKFKIGKLQLENYSIVQLDLSNVNSVFEMMSGMRICGLLGSDFLNEYKAKIDYEKKLLTLKY